MKVITIANTNINELVQVDNEQVVTESRKVAETFGKEHSKVIRSIEKIITEAKNGLSDLAAENSAAKFFYETIYKANSGKSNKMYLMNRDGFRQLVMGFTGAKAMQWKLKYIEAFNTMEKLLKEQQRPAKPLDVTKQMRAEAMLNNSQARKAKLLYEIAKSTSNNLYRQAGEALAVNMLAGQKVMPMPEAEQRPNHELGYFCRFIGKAETWATVLGKKLKQAGVVKNAETGVYKVMWDKKNNQRDTFYWFDDVLLPKLAELFPSDYKAI